MFQCIKTAFLNAYANYRERVAEDAAVGLAHFAQKKRMLLYQLDKAEAVLLEDAREFREKAIEARRRVENLLK